MDFDRREGERWLDLRDLCGLAGPGSIRYTKNSTLTAILEKIQNDYDFIFLPDNAGIGDLLNEREIGYVRIAVIRGYVEDDIDPHPYCRMVLQVNNHLKNEVEDYARRLLLNAALTNLSLSLSQSDKFIEAVESEAGRLFVYRERIFDSLIIRKADALDMLLGNFFTFTGACSQLLPYQKQVAALLFGRPVDDSPNDTEAMDAAVNATWSYYVDLHQALDLNLLIEQFGPFLYPEKDEEVEEE